MKQQPDTPSPLDRWWLRLLVAAWIIAIVTIYFWLQIRRLLEMAGARP